MIRLAALILLRTASLIQTGDASHQISLTVAELSHDVTLHCEVSRKVVRYINWYKQSLGQMPQAVAGGVFGQKSIDEFTNPRFTVTEEESRFSLTIRNVSKEDEATYFCQTATAFSTMFVNGTFLVVNDSNQQKSVFVTQSPKTESVQLGDTATLHCSLLSKETQSNVQCPGEHSVYWFRTGSGGFHPNIIYTQRNSSDEDRGRSCDYRLSKAIRGSADTGTYYCAVVTCGQILLGEGTTVDTRSGLDPVVLVLGGLLACCVTVIILLICGLCKGERNVPHDLVHDKSTTDRSNNLDDQTTEVNYAAVDFSTRRKKREKTEMRQFPGASVYSSLNCHN
ncbi:immunoglobulin kappa light chain-like isoform X2 [Parambassis ranga]|uniref:immunoglobulin kappa light chain-like isoform X2 n=1 Tax=Parambassis ranga TaxID=210632 RepID=UPI0010423CF4|nr:immunoglobulin kappa light chain-like isoform X2 [Parambassis ranga]